MSFGEEKQDAVTVVKPSTASSETPVISIGALLDGLELVESDAPEEEALKPQDDEEDVGVDSVLNKETPTAITQRQKDTKATCLLLPILAD